MDSKLWYDLHHIVSSWAVEHPDLTVDELVDDLHDYVIVEFGPPF